MRTIEASGFLFIGDPHVSSTRPGRRKDDYLSSVLGKLSEAAALCRQENLHPVILGDLFHFPHDNNLAMLNRLIRTLREFPVAPDCLGGNHDKSASKVSDADALTLVELAGAVFVHDEPGLATRLLGVTGHVSELHAVPYGSPIPARIDSQANAVVVITHHDLAFGGAYPGAQPLQEVVGAQMLVNGHMHDTKPSVTMGGTRLHNPGNIEPLSVDLADFQPKVWSWTAASGNFELNGHALAHGVDLFDMTGLQVKATDAEQAVGKLGADSAFADLLLSDSTLDAERTEDASVIRGDLAQILDGMNATPATRALFGRLAAKLGVQPAPSEPGESLEERAALAAETADQPATAG